MLMMNSRETKKVRFINTFEPVVPIYRYLCRALRDAGIDPLFMMSLGSYRAMGKGAISLLPYIEWIWVPEIFRKNKRVCALLYYLFAPFMLLLRPADMNIILTQPPLFHVVGAWISKFMNIPYIIHVMDMYPELLVKNGVIKGEGFIERALSRRVTNASREAKAVIVLGRCMRARMLRAGVEPSKVLVCHNGASNAVMPVEKENRFRKQYGLVGKFVVLYSGNMGKAHEFSTALEIARRIEENKEITFVFVGTGSRRSEVERATKKLNNVRLLDFQPEDRLAMSLGSADIHFISLRKGFEGLMVPSKLYGALASARPVVYEGCDTGEAAMVIREANCGTVVPYRDADFLEKTILKYYRSPELMEAEGARARKVYEDRFSRLTGAEAYVKRILDTVF